MATKAFNGPAFTPSLAEGCFNPTGQWLDDHGLTRNAHIITPASSTAHKDVYEASLAAPGLSKDDTGINVEGDSLITRSPKEEQREQMDNRFTRQDHRYTPFTRSFAMPNDHKREAIAARYANGVLNRKLPRKGEAQRALPPKTIAVK